MIILIRSWGYLQFLFVSFDFGLHDPFTAPSSCLSVRPTPDPPEGNGVAELLHGKGFDTETPLGRGRVPEFLSVFVVFARFPSVSGRVSCPPGPVLKSVFLGLCFRRQKSPCMGWVPEGNLAGVFGMRFRCLAGPGGPARPVPRCT